MAANVKSIVTLHLFCWLLFMSMPVIFVSGRHPTTIAQLLSSFHFWFFMGFFLFVFYLHYYVLINKLLLRKKYLAYALIILGFFVAVYFGRPFDRIMIFMHPFEMQEKGEIPTGDSDEAPIDIMSVFLLVMFLAIGLAVKLAQRWQNEMEQLAMAEARRSNAELSLLKARINPHFLFNTLNNIYSLAVTKSDMTADAIIRLSNIMRYVTDEASDEFVLLSNEIDYIRDYIDLLRMRLSKKVTVDFLVEGDPTGRRIAPMILMPFIENAFKHGISSHNESEVIIQLNIFENEIHLNVKNTIHAVPRNERKGQGVYNTRKRLDYLYHGRYTLRMQQHDHYFILQLRLKDV